MKFLETLKEMEERFPDQPRRFQVIAARWKLGVETQESIENLVVPPSDYSRPRLSYGEARIIIHEIERVD